MQTRIKPCTLLFLLSFCCCKKVIQVNLNDAAPQIVIQGEVNDQPGPYKMYVTKTVNFSASNYFPPVSGAKVIISDNKGLIDSLAETAPGEYSSHSFWQGKPGNSYTATVMILSKSYIATSTMPKPVPLDSISFLTYGSFSGKTTISVVPNFQDPPGIANYYQFAEIINGNPLHKTYLLDDRLSDGKYIHQVLYDDSVHIKKGDLVALKMYCVDAPTYRYLDEMHLITDNNQSVTPANPDTNFSNGALGIFSAHTYVSKQAVAN